jgi:hypothetical protein
MIMNENEKLVDYDLKWSYEDTKTVKIFTVSKCTSIERIAVRFMISKKKNKIRYIIMYCNLSDYIKESIEMIEAFIKKYGDIISEDRKDIQLPM